MLHILFNKYDNSTITEEQSKLVQYHAPSWFDNWYEDSWLEDEFVKSMVRDVDKSELMGKVVISPVLGSISIKDLSSGVKTLICVYCAGNPEGMIFDTRSCGDNCTKWLGEIGKRRDVTVSISHDTYDFGETVAICENDGSVLNGDDEIVAKMFEIL